LRWESVRKEKLSFEESWRDAKSVEELLALYSARPESILQPTAREFVVDKFRRFCATDNHAAIRACLEAQEFREHILLAAPRILNNILNTNQGKAKLMKSVSTAPSWEVTLQIILNEPVFANQLTEDDLMLALNKNVGSEIIEKMLDLCKSRNFPTSATLLNYKNRHKKNLMDDEVCKNISLLEGAITEREAYLNSQGRYVNSNVITCSDSECRGLALSFFLPFKQGEYGDGEEPFLRIEQEFMSLSQLVRLKTNWREKCGNLEITEKWKAEIAEQDGDLQLFELVLQQVRLLAAVGMEEGYEVSPVDNVYLSDTIISPEVSRQWQQAAASLESSTPPDYHPGSNQQVIDVVHPSLYPAVAGRTRVLDYPALSLEASWRENIGNLGLRILSTFDMTAGRSRSVCLSEKFQWLPAEFHVEEDSTVHINSYINNLHPETHAGVYDAVARVFGCCLPLLEQVLSDNIIKDKLRLIVDPSAHQMYEDEPSDMEDDDAYEEYFENRVPISIPLPASFPTENIRHYLAKKVSLRNKRLQVIVKVATIELTPEKPSYGGGTWHVEGMKNEEIVCSLIHYYSCENITESRLHFRQAIREPDYEQNDNRGVEERYNLSDEDPLNQALGHIVTKEGRTVAFPNLFQHRVDPFELVDKSLPGHRKILVYFVVNPLVRVLSTAEVPPQQQSWVARSYDSPVHRILSFWHIPDEVIAYLFEFLDFPISKAEADDIRDKLMAERSVYVDQLTETVYERPFSLCEH